MDSSKLLKETIEAGNPDQKVSLDDSVDINLKIANSEGALLILYRHLFILNPLHLPPLLISLISQMCLNETSQFNIPQALFVTSLSKWINRESTTDATLQISVNEIYKPIDLIQDGNYIWRITASSKGQSLPHKKAKYKISASLQANGTVLVEITNRIVRAKSLPYLWEQALMNMCEGESVIVECSLDNENAQYLSGSGTEFDVDRYLTAGKAVIYITLYQFIIGKSVIKSVSRSLNSLNLSAKQSFELKNYEDCEQLYTEIIQTIGKINDPSFYSVSFR
jgi:hypothetical protein